MPSGMVVSKTGNGNVLSAGHCDLLTLVVKFKSCRKHNIYRKVSLNPDLSRGGARILINTVPACNIFTLEICIYCKLQTEAQLINNTTLWTHFSATNCQQTDNIVVFMHFEDM